MRRSRLLVTGITLLAILLVSVSAIMAQTTTTGCQNRVTVWDNDTLTSIAARYNVSVNALASANGLAVNAQLKIGQVLCLDGVTAQGTPAPTIATTPGTGGPIATATPTRTPTTSGTTIVTATTTAPTAQPGTRGLGFIRGQNPNPPAGWTVYIVEAGDTLFGISRRFNSPMQNIMAANNITNPSVVYRGESLLVPGTAAPTAVATSRTPVATTAPGTATATVAPPPSTGGIPLPPAGAGTIPAINLQPVRAAPGDTVTVLGSNYPPGVSVDLYIERPSLGLKSSKLATATVGADGRFTYNLTIPETWDGTTPVQTNIISISGYAPGGYWGMNFIVNTEAPTGAPGGTPATAVPTAGATTAATTAPTTGAGTGTPAAATATAVPGSSTGATPFPTPPAGRDTIPLLALSPTTARPGSTITVTGSNYPPNVAIDLYLEKPTLGLKTAKLATVTSAANGTFTTTLTLPTTWDGSRAIVEAIVSVSGYAPGGYWAMNYFVNQ